MNILDQDIYIGGESYSLGDFQNMSKENQLEKMREWFFENYEDPAERTPYESKEGGFIYIWGGPYYAREELGVFGEFVEDELIEKLANELSSDCPEWTGRESPEDYDNSYFDSISSGNKYYESFNISINHIQAISEIYMSSDAKQHLLGILYVNVITAVEAYLSDAFIANVFDDASALRRFVETNPVFKNKSFNLSELFIKHDSIDQEVKGYLLGLMWHNIQKIKPMYKATLDVNFPADLSYIFKAISKRHDLVHRGGKNKAGEGIVITGEDLQSLILEVTNFIDMLNSQLDGDEDSFEL